MQITDREKNIFFVLLISLGLFISVKLVISPLREEGYDLQKSIFLQKKKLNKNWKILDRRSVIDSEYGRYLDEFKQQGENEWMMSQFLADVQGVAKKISIKISEIEPKEVDEEKYLNKFSVGLTIKSQFSEIIEFLTILQSQPYIFNVDEIRMERRAYREGNIIKTRLILSKNLIH